jgi:DNA-binding transcriptional MerR regulator
MNLFSISDLEQYSGVKAHTIRIWEQRYNALSPQRSQGNTRYYDGIQLLRLLNIVSLNEANYKISKLCAMSDSELHAIIEAQLHSEKKMEDTSEYFISQLIATALTFNEANFEKIFTTCVLRFGLKNSYIKIIYPMLVRIGLMWTSESIPATNEHFVCNLIKQKLFSAINDLPVAKTTEQLWLLFLPEDEFHEIGLLFSQYIIKQMGVKVINLGPNVPFNELVKTIKLISPSHLLLFLVHNYDPEVAQTYVSNLKKNIDNSKLLIAGNQKVLSQLKLSNDIFLLKDADDLIMHLA